MNPTIYNTYAQPKRFNTFIGGLGGSQFTTKTELASFLSLQPTDINYFEVVGADIKCNIDVNYEIPVGAFKDNLNITSYEDRDGKVTKINGLNDQSSAFLNSTILKATFPSVSEFNFASFKNSLIEEVICSNLITVLSNNSFVGTNLKSFKEKNGNYVDFVNLTTLGSDALKNTKIKEFYANSSNLSVVGQNIFENATELEKLEMNYLQTITRGLLKYTTVLDDIILPAVTSTYTPFNTNDSPIQFSGVKRFICNNLTDVPQFFFNKNPNLYHIELRGIQSLHVNSAYSAVGSNVPSGTQKVLIVPQAFIDDANNTNALNTYIGKGYTILDAESN